MGQGLDLKGSCLILVDWRLLHAKMNIDPVDQKDLQSVMSTLHDDPRCSVVGGRVLEMVQAAVLRVGKVDLEKCKVIGYRDSHVGYGSIVCFAAHEYRNCCRHLVGRLASSGEGWNADRTVRDDPMLATLGVKLLEWM